MKPLPGPALPDDTVELKRLCLEAFQTIHTLQEQLSWFKRQTFGQKADTVPPLPGMVDLFAGVPLPVGKPAPVKETITYERTKGGHGRKSFPDHLPRVVEVVEPEAQAKVCSCCGGPKEKIGEDVCEVLEHEPQKLYVRRILRPKYACPRHAEEGVTQAKAPGRLIPKGNVGEGLLAQVLLEKYVNHQPLSRQETNFRRLGVSIAVSTMVTWMEAATGKLSGIVEEMRRRIVSGGIAYSDDTPLPVLREDREGSTHRGFMWVYSNGSDAVVFHYTSGRGRAGPQEILKDFKGYLHTDAYSVYGTLHATGEVVPVFCWAHARRKFVSALQAGDERARRPVQWIGRLFRVDRFAKSKGMAAEAVQALRQRVSGEILKRLDRSLKALEPSVLPKSALGEAVGYLRGHWDGFRTFLTHGALSLDNNLSERQIRQVVIGRRNYFFCGSEEGARRAAILYSLVCTCKILQVDPWKYLTRVFAALAEDPQADPAGLTPATLKKDLG